MNLTVFAGPDSGMNIEALFRRTPFAGVSMCAVVPDFRSAAVMERRITDASAGAVLSHRVYTFDGLASAILSLGISPPGLITGHVKRALITEIIRSRIGRQSEYAEVAETRGFIRAVESLLEEIRAGHGEVYIQDEFMPVAKAYESHLGRLGVTDHEGLLKAVLSSPELIRAFADSCSGPLVVDGFYDLTGNQFSLLEALMRLTRRSSVALVTDESRPELFSLPLALLDRYRGIGARIIKVPGNSKSGTGTVLCGFMGGLYQGTGSREDVSLDFFSSAASEADWVAGTVRTLLVEKKCRPENIMIAARNIPGYTSQTVIALRRHGIPVEGGMHIPLVSTPFIRFVFDVLDASVIPTEENILRVQRSGFFGITVSGGKRESGFQDDRAWSAMTAEIDSPEGFAASTKRMLETLNVPGYLDGAGDKVLAISERALYERLLVLLDEFASFYMTFKPMMRAGEFVRLFRQFISDVTLPASPAVGQGVLVLGVEHARYVSRDIVFFTGLDNNAFPSRTERFSLHDKLTAARLGKHREQEEPLLFYMTMNGARKLVLTFSGLNNEGSDEAVSPYVREIKEGIAAWSKPVIHKGVPGAAWEHGPISGRGRIESIVRELVTTPGQAGKLMNDLREQNRELFTLTENTIRMVCEQADRNDLSLSNNESVDILKRNYGPDCIVSVTDIENYLDCPVHYFLGRVLGLEPERIAQDGLDPGERGSIMHDILAAFYAERQKTTGSGRFSRDETDEVMDTLNTVIDAVFSKRQDWFRRVSPTILASEKRMIRRWLRAIIEIEASWYAVSPYQPHKFEVPFGTNNEPPLQIASDDTVIHVSGRVDRIDVADNNGAAVSRIVDYKTGKSPGKKDVQRGTALQLALYIAAANELLAPDLTVEEAVYYSLRDASFNQEKKAITGCTRIEGADSEVIDTAKKMAVEAVECIRRGQFPAPENCSDRCEWYTLCRGGRDAGEEADHADR